MLFRSLQFALDPLRQLLKQLPHTGYQLTLHTDQGWHYQHRAWRKLTLGKACRIEQPVWITLPVKQSLVN